MYYIKLDYMHDYFIAFHRNLANFHFLAGTKIELMYLYWRKACEVKQKK